MASVLASIEGPIVLVGHSYGGAVITNAAAGNFDVKALVYVAAFAPDKGDQLGVLLNKYPGSLIGSSVQGVPLPQPGRHHRHRPLSAGRQVPGRLRSRPAPPRRAGR
ncbi:alpha/beta fold hydrolase [Streptomyces mirabilis]|uniref:alpha/beta fold hydrolase n=1 Tax=Streptomyces TaxID=1883 RepID=UPI00359C3C73